MFSILLRALSLVQISYQHSAFKHLKSVFVPKEKYVMNFKLLTYLLHGAEPLLKS